MKPHKVVIIIPTFNEAAIIKQTLHKLFIEIAKLQPYDVAVIVFDSHSADKTQAIVQALMTKYQNLYLLNEPEKTGLGSAYVQAMKVVMQRFKADIILEYDADGSHQPKYLARLLATIKAGAHVAIGSRYIKGGGLATDWPLYRRIISRCGNLLAQFILTPRYKDWTSGFRATKAFFLQQAINKQFISSQFAYKIELFWRLHKLDARIVEVPIIFVDREAGVSKFPRNNILESLKVVFTLRLKELQTYVRMCYIGLTGLLVQFVAFNFLRSFFNPIFSNGISIELAIIINFFFHNTLTFRAQKIGLSKFKTMIKKIFQFNALSFGSLVCQIIFTALVMPQIFGIRLLENTVVLLGIILGSIINYFGYTRLVWGKA